MPTPRPRTSTLLWQLDREGTGQGCSYLFGTMHVRDSRAFRWMPVVEPALSECDCLALEIDLASPMPPDFLQRARLPDGQSLYRLLGARTFQKIRKILKKAHGLELLQFNHSLPILVMQAIDATILTGDHPVALDEALFALARDKGKPVIGLETIESQAELLGKIPLSRQLYQLKGIARSISRHRASMRKFADWYARGNLHGIYKAARRGAGPMKNDMIRARNRVMAERLAEYLPATRVFAAVGAGHLPGQWGMLRLLKQAGYRVKPVARPIWPDQ